MLEKVFRSLPVILFVAGVAWPVAARGDRSPDAGWPQWRGPMSTGVAPGADPPLRWSESENVRWKVEIPGRGHASPIVWGDKVYLLTAVPTGAPEPEPEEAGRGDRRRRGVAPTGPVRFLVLALDRASGEIAWQRLAREETPHEGTHRDATWASASAITDGEVLIAHFGSRGIYAYDLEGEPLWQKDLGDMRTRNGFGEGASPALAAGTVVVTWDHEDDSFIVALDAKTGKERWRADRPEVTSWATPVVVPAGERNLVIANATERIRAYDLDTGEVVWQTGGMTTNTVPTPVFADGLLFAMSGFRGNALRAVRLDGARGELGDEAIAWTYDRDTPYVPSPVLYGGSLYFLKHNSGIVTSLDAATGEVNFGPERLPGIEGVYASPVAAADRVYVAGRDGTTVVLKHGKSFEVLSSNILDDGFDASPAVVGNELYLRGRRYLYRIEQSEDDDG